MLKIVLFLPFSITILFYLLSFLYFIKLFKSIFVFKSITINLQEVSTLWADQQVPGLHL